MILAKISLTMLGRKLTAWLLWLQILLWEGFKGFFFGTAFVSDCDIKQVKKNVDDTFDASTGINTPENLSTLSDTLLDAKLSNNAHGLKNYEKFGGYNKALEDFSKFEFSAVKDLGNQIKIGELKGGTGRVILRPKSSGNPPTPTLEIQKINSKGKAKPKLKIRY